MWRPWPEMAATLVAHPRWPSLHIVGDPADEHPAMVGALLCALRAECPTAWIEIEAARTRVTVSAPDGRRHAVSGATPCEAFGWALLIAWGPA